MGVGVAVGTGVGVGSGVGAGLGVAETVAEGAGSEGLTLALPGRVTAVGFALQLLRPHAPMRMRAIVGTKRFRMGAMRVSTADWWPTGKGGGLTLTPNLAPCHACDRI